MGIDTDLAPGTPVRVACGVHGPSNPADPYGLHAVVSFEWNGRYVDTEDDYLRLAEVAEITAKDCEVGPMRVPLQTIVSLEPTGEAPEGWEPPLEPGLPTEEDLAQWDRWHPDGICSDCDRRAVYCTPYSAKMEQTGGKYWECKGCGKQWDALPAVLDD